MSSIDPAGNNPELATPIVPERYVPNVMVCKSVKLDLVQLHEFGNIPAIMFDFFTDGAHAPPIVLTQTHGLVEIFEMIQDAADEMRAKIVAAFQEEAAATDPGFVHCRCGKRLFGDRATLGYCGDCGDLLDDPDWQPGG